jgi:hypothetical protein
VRFAPLRWLFGKEFLEITLAGPRVVLTRRPDGTYDLLDHLRGDGAPESAPPNAPQGDVAPTEPDDSAEPAFDPASELVPADVDVPETDDAGDGADPVEHPSIDSTLWTRTNDPFTVLHGVLNVSDGELLIVDPAVGARTELHGVVLAVLVGTDEMVTFGVVARQRGREGGEGTIKATGSVAFNKGVRFWYDPAETLRRIELEAEARLAPCTVGDLDVGGEIRASVRAGHATLTADGALNHGTASVRAEARVVPLSRAVAGDLPSRAVAGDLQVELRSVDLCPAFGPILTALNPIFDVGNGRLAGRIDTTWTGNWSASPAGRQRSRSQGHIEVKELAASGAPLAAALLDWLGERGDELTGDLLARDIRSENGRLSYDRMTLAGPDRHLVFAGAIAEDGVLRLTCEASSRTAGPAGGGAPLRVPIVGWVDEPRLLRPARP